MLRMREADAMPSDGVVQHSGTPANTRRRAHFDILREAWSHFFPEDRLTLNDMSTWLNLPEAGWEGEMVLDHLYNFAATPRQRPLNFPRGAFVTALRRSLRPAERTKESHPAARHKPSDSGAKPSKSKDPKPQEPKPQQLQADVPTLENVKRMYREAGIDYAQNHMWVHPDTPADVVAAKQLSHLETLKKHPEMVAEAH